ncbi:phosphoribosylaminoimidazole carboxylase, partial [candidate division NPL-UPA2 bacterium]|nr:phosphoribosylaminoimidazole carboxylase [candidate division NPL-UPA2 bacterium]
MEEILKKLKSGKVTIKEAEALLEKRDFGRLKLKLVDKLARLDIYREDRTGIPEAILAEGKKPAWAVKLTMKM